MIRPHAAQLIAADRIAELQRASATARLATIARCCQPGGWAHAGRHVTRTATRLQAALRRAPVGAACCAGA